jgi:lipopolysaccharide transport system ATP-binding protein
VSIAVSFDQVCKHFTLFLRNTGGLKSFLLNLPKRLNELRSRKFEVLCDLTFEVRQGEAFGIIGRNGAGKSTTLGLIAGVLIPSSGQVTVKGRVSPLIELGAGFHQDLTGRDNIMLNGVLMGLTRADVKRKMNEIIEYSELGEFIEQPLRCYSSGMVARLGFSVVSQLEPEILLIDEVLAVGDLEFQKKCLATMDDFRKSGVTIIMVSHSMKDITSLCSRVLWLDNHRMKMIGEAAEVTRSFVESMG